MRRRCRSSWTSCCGSPPARTTPCSTWKNWKSSSSPRSAPPTPIWPGKRGRCWPAVATIPMWGSSTPSMAAPIHRLDQRSLGLAVRQLCRRDPHLAAAVRRWGGPPLWTRRPGFVTLLRIILEQQVSLASAKAMYLRLRRHLGEISPYAVHQLGPSGLRALGFTRQKAGYCHGVALELLEARLDLRRLARADDHTARSTLLALKGVGPWSADIYLLMALG